MADGAGERSVTLALINSKVDTLLEEVAEIKASLKEYEKRLRDNETGVTRLSERVGIFSGVAVAVSAALSAAINWFSRK